MKMVYDNIIDYRYLLIYGVLDIAVTVANTYQRDWNSDKTVCKFVIVLHQI